MAERTLQGALTFLGFAIGVLAVFYFAFEYIPRVSPWSQLGGLVLLGLFFAFLGVYLRSTVVGQPFFDAPRLQWLWPPVVMYLLALLCGIVAEIRFLSIDDVPRPLKILASLVIAILLIVAVARRRQPPRPAASAAPSPRARPSRGAKARPRRVRA
jgi:H+/Cl- antiporter ClcA